MRRLHVDTSTWLFRGANALLRRCVLGRKSSKREFELRKDGFDGLTDLEMFEKEKGTLRT